MLELYLKDWLLSDVLQGKKTLEVRIKNRWIGSIRAGETIRLSSSTRSTTVFIIAIREYPSFAQMLATEDYRRIASIATSADQVLQGLRAMIRKERESNGVVVIEFTLVPPP